MSGPTGIEPTLTAHATLKVKNADAHRDDGKRFVVRADEKLNCFSGTRIGGAGLRTIVLTSRRDSP